MNQLTTIVTEVLRQPAALLLAPERRVFAPYLALSLAIAFATLLLRGVGPVRAWRALTSRRLWLHRSARLDYQLIAAKAALNVLVAGSYAWSAVAVTALTASWLRRHLGSAPVVDLSPWTVGVIFTTAAFVADDWTRFLVHRWMHRVPALWAFHRVHHSAEVLTPLTLYRTHPVEVWVNSLRGALAIGGVAGLCSWLWGPKLPAWQLLGVDAIGLVWTLLGANLRHCQVWLSYGRWLEHLLVSPAQHQLHHSRSPRHVDKNFGTALSVWDWMAGSLEIAGPARVLRFGLPRSEGCVGRSVGALLVNPFVALLPRWARPSRAEGLAPSPGAQLRSPGSLAAVGGAVVGAGGWPRGAGRYGVVGLLLLTSCSSKKLDRGELLQSFALCTVGSYRDTLTEAQTLVTVAQAHAAAPTVDTLGAVRRAWERTIDSWQVAEMMQVGPAGDVATTVGGRTLRAAIYSWPDVNRCLIDEQLVSRVYETAAVSTLSTSTRGLAALEYLLFYEGPDNGCDPTNAINSGGAWAALSGAELTARKAVYARALAVELVATLQTLLDSWDGGGFSNQLVTAGRGSTLFATQQLAISAVADAVFRFYTEVKDARLGKPMGLKDCPATSCPEAFESPIANRGKQHLRGNVAGARRLLEGCAAGGGLGFDDLLESVGAGALATQLREDLSRADAAIDALPNDALPVDLAQHPAELQAVYAAVSELSDFLKLEFVAALQISSVRVEGDND
jgi:sterol desaturase/sphingolipid hydroxylase (fatty acid hydroxylase superfamily)/predicted lipoprotein